jgi:dCTP deaminase
MIYPLSSEAIRGSSVDVTLGEWFYATDRISNQGGYNPFDRSDVERYFGEPKQAIPHAEWSESHKGMHWEGIPDDHPIIVLGPHERILAHTHEFIGIKPPGTTEMRARSTWGRNGVVVCKDAGWGDPGFISRWTMEIQNDNDEMVPLPAGERIAQIIFHQTGAVSRHYGEGGKYQGGKRLSTIVHEWTAAAMLPHAYDDERVLPIPTDIDEVIQLDEIAYSHSFPKR